MESPTSMEMDFSEYWSNSIDKEVSRGIKIRDEKIQIHQTNSIYQHEFPNLDFNKPSTSKYGVTTVKRKIKLEEKMRPHHVRKKSSKKYKNPRKLKRRSKCQMRIAELAVPSKRYIMETWRSKWNTLPIHMVDRFKQIVLDQKPVVPISDAIRCFKRDKRMTTGSPRKPKAIENKKIAQIKMMCALFGHRITVRLLAPQNLSLSSRLIPISNVVNKEISFLFHKRKLFYLQKNIIIQNEIVTKVTNWIADIIEQSSYNLMIEDYRELEEEEGHIWDIIDDLVDNAILLCKEPSISSSSVDAKSSVSNEYFSNDEIRTPSESSHSDDDNLNEFENIISNIVENIITTNGYKIQDENTSETSLNATLHDEGDDGKLSSENLVNDIIDLILDYIENAKMLDSETIKSYNSDIFETTNTDDVQNNLKENESDDEIVDQTKDYKVNKEIDSTNDIEPVGNALVNDIMDNDEEDTIKNIFDPINKNKEENISSPENEINEVDTELFQNNVDAHKFDLNESDKLNNTTEESLREPEESEDIPSLRDATSENSIKKVKFSDINIDSGYRQLNISGDADQWDNHNRLKTINMYFAPPNDNLLSDADEPWPENLRFPMVKATVSVSKSVLSLGNIMEVEENSNDPRFKNKNINSIEDRSDETEQIFYDTYDRIIRTDSSLKHSNNNLIKDTIIMTIDGEVQCELINELNSNTKNVTNEIDGIHRIIYDKLSEKHLSTIDIYPEIVTQNRHSFDAADEVLDLKLRETHMRIWCKGLLNVTNNLNIWLDWINNSCSFILYLNQKGKEKFLTVDQKTHTCNCKRIKLRTNIDSDAKLWKKLSASLQTGLKSYKSYYNRSKAGVSNMIPIILSNSDSGMYE